MQEPTQADRIANEGAEIEIDGKAYKLSFGNRALYAIEKQFGGVGKLFREILPDGLDLDTETVDVDLADFEKLMGPRFFEGMEVALRQGLWKYRLTDEQFDEIFDKADLFTALGAVMEGLMTAFPKAQEVEAAKANQSASTGSRATISPRSSLEDESTNSGR